MPKAWLDGKKPLKLASSMCKGSLFRTLITQSWSEGQPHRVSMSSDAGTSPAPSPRPSGSGAGVPSVWLGYVLMFANKVLPLQLCLLGNKEDWEGEVGVKLKPG
uniref:Uncharacterized protein n=1 Tax=Panagrellus redivivus TaxID=6233 RepID=A0A7E4W6G3_PANRE